MTGSRPWRLTRTAQKRQTPKRSGQKQKHSALFRAAADIDRLALALPAAGGARGGTGPVMLPNGIGAVDLGPSPTSLGTAIRAGDKRAGLRTGTLAGKTYWQTRMAAGHHLLRLGPTAAYSPASPGKPVARAVTYYDGGSGE